MDTEHGRGSDSWRAELTAWLRPHNRIGIDTAIFIYHLEAHPRYLPLTHFLLSMVQRGQVEAVTSTMTLMEITVRPWQLGQEAIARQYEVLLLNFPHLTIWDADRDIARQAAQFRGRHRIRPVDALQVATALVHGASAFVTNDRTLKRLHTELDILILEDLLPPSEPSQP